MRIKYILSGLVGIIVLFGGLSRVGGTGEARRNAEQALGETLALLGKTPLVAQTGPVYFVPVASLAQAGGTTSDAPRSLIDTVRADNPFYRRSEELLATAAELYAAEKYDESRETGLEAQRFARLAEQEADQQVKRQEVDKTIASAESRLKSAEAAVNQLKKNAPRTAAPASFKDAEIAFAEARSARDTKDWDAVAPAAARAKNSADATITAVEQLLKDAKRNDYSGASAEGYDQGGQSFSDASSASGAWSSAASGAWSSAGTAPVVALPPERQASAQAPASAPAGGTSSAVASASAQPRGTQPSGIPSVASPSRPTVSPAGSAARTPAPPALSAPAVSPSPRVPDLSGTAPQQTAVVAAPPSSPAPQQTASAPAPRAPAIADNTPPVPSLAPLNTGTALAAAPSAPTPTVPGMPAGAPRTGSAQNAAQTAAQAQIAAQAAAQGTASSQSPLRNSAIPNPAAETASGAPHIASSLGQEEETPIAQAGGVRLAAQYRVMAWGTSGDCLWNIAAKPWVYGDPRKWTDLYRANVRKLPDSQNPNLLPPNVVLDIPSLNSEQRQGVGTWKGVSTTTP